MPFSVFAAPTLQVDNEEAIFLPDKGKKQSLSSDEFEVHPIMGNGMQFLTVNEDAKENYGLEPGVYLFDKAGKQIAAISVDSPESCYDVQFSPNGKIIAVDQGTSVIRSWQFLSYPDLKPIGDVSYAEAVEGNSLFWNNNEGVVYSFIDGEDTSRTCGYDPCGPTSVMYYSFTDKKETPILWGWTCPGLRSESALLYADIRSTLGRAPQGDLTFFAVRWRGIGACSASRAGVHG